MGLMKSAALAPDAILLPANFEAYRHYSRLFKAAVRAIAPRLEDRGIDEIYLDLTVLPAEEIPARIWPLPVRKVNGIGLKAGEKLAALGIATIGDLAAAPQP